jgi:hypothetical protein
MPEEISDDPNELTILRKTLKREKKTEKDPAKLKVLNDKIRDLKFQIRKLNSTNQESHDASGGADQIGHSHPSVAAPVKPSKNPGRKAAKSESTQNGPGTGQPRGRKDSIKTKDSRGSRTENATSPIDSESSDSVFVAPPPQKRAKLSDPGGTRVESESTAGPNLPEPLSGQPRGGRQSPNGIRNSSPRRPASLPASADPGAAAAAADESITGTGNGAESLLLLRSTQDGSKIQGSAPKRVQSTCTHGRRKSQCKECGGRAFCQHGRRRSQCKDCKGSGICTHSRQRSQCKECKGVSICVHGRQKSKCKDCGGGSICSHGRIKSRCKDCGGGSICGHGRRKQQCMECFGSSICLHGRQKWHCKDCMGRAEAEA